MWIARALRGLVAGVLVTGSLVLACGPVTAAPGYGVPRTGLPIPVPTPANAPHASGYTSMYTTNWAGYMQKVGTSTGPYTAVRDDWTVPVVDTSQSGDQYSADWVGIDGGNPAKPNCNCDLVQDGTSADNINGTPHYYAWTEIVPAAPVTLSSLTVQPGDRMQGLVEETSKNHWLMVVYDLTTGNSGSRSVTYDASNGGPASQTSAEAIHERPDINGGQPATLARTSSVTFDPGSYSTATYTPSWKQLLTAAPKATVERVFMNNKPGGSTIAAPSLPSTDKNGFTVADGATAPPAPWGTAEEIPGTDALNTGGDADGASVSCASAGNCSAGGYYTGNSGWDQAFVVTQTDGTWGIAQQVPGLAALGTGGNAAVSAVSCTSAGNCSAIGLYTTNSGVGQGFVVTETGGSWGTAEPVPGLAALNQGGLVVPSSVSCASAGNCSAGGFYTDSNLNDQAFVVNETNGTWDSAKQVPGTASLNKYGAQVTSVSCGSAGNCSAVGYYTDGSGASQAFLVNQTNGAWGTATQVPGLAALNTGREAELASVSCPAAGNCSAGGYYVSSALQAFVVSQTKGTWGKAKEVPGIASLNKGGNAQITSVSCASAGNCSVGGYYTDGAGAVQAFVVSQTKGSWGKAKEAPGTASLNKGGNAQVNSVSCASAGNCSAVGFYTDATGSALQAFVVSQANGKWGTAQQIPDTGSLNQSGTAWANSVSCASVGNCSAVGLYVDTSGNQAFVAVEPSI
jgi:hypothetical protein